MASEEAEARKELLRLLSGGKYRSWEELYMSWWLDELIQAGYVESYSYEKRTLVLMSEVKVPWFEQKKTGVKEKLHHLFHESTYTPDFGINWTPKAEGIFIPGRSCNKRPYFIGAEFDGLGASCLIDVKGDHAMGASKGNFSQFSFPYKQKMAYQNLKIYVQKVVPVKLFRDTFIPTRYFKTDGGKQTRNLTSLTNPKPKGKKKKDAKPVKTRTYTARTLTEFIKEVGPIQQNLLT
jgi:hypothetical protein